MSIIHDVSCFICGRNQFLCFSTAHGNTTSTRWIMGRRDHCSWVHSPLFAKRLWHYAAVQRRWHSDRGNEWKNIQLGSGLSSRQLSRSSLIILSILGILSGLVEFLWKKQNKPKRMKRVKNPSHAKVKPPRVWMVILFVLTFYLVVFHTLANLPLSNPLLFGIHQRFWMHPNILMYILIGVWLYKIITSMPNKLTQLIAIGVVLVIPCTTYRQNRSVSDQSSNRFFRKYALSILESLPNHSLLLINYDQ